MGNLRRDGGGGRMVSLLLLQGGGCNPGGDTRTDLGSQPPRSWRTGLQRNARSRLDTSRRSGEGYNSFINIIFDVLMAKKLGKKPPSEKQLATKLVEYKKMLLIWADAHVIKMWDEVESRLANTDEDPKKVLLMWDSLLREMRKDLGKDDSKLDDGDLVSLILLAEEKHKVKD